jgi:helicase MOV-10
MYSMFHDEAKEQTRMCPRMPHCKFYSYGDCWFAHEESELRCESFATAGSCPLPKERQSDGKLRCPRGLHTRAGSSIQQVFSNKADDEFVGLVDLPEAVSDGSRPRAAMPMYSKALASFFLPEEIDECIAQSKEELRDSRKRAALLLAIETLLRRQLPTNDAPLTGQNFRTVLQTLLFVDEAQKISDMRRYDVANADLQYQSHSRMWSIKVPSLAEKRPSVLRGDVIKLHDRGTNDVHNGYVHFVNLDEVVVSFGGETLIWQGPYDVYFMLTRTQWRCQHRAITESTVFIDDACSTSAVVARNHHNTQALTQAVISLTEMQAAFVAKLFHEPRGLHLLWGPPGTGKTTTLVRSIYALALANPDASILVAAPSNAAVDVITSRLVSKFPQLMERLLRVNSLTRATKDVAADILKVCTQPESGSFSFPGRDRLQRGGRIILSTLNTCARIDSVVGYDANHFDFIVIDEAGQATETELLLVCPMARHGATRFLIAGDHKQLGPILPSALVNIHAARSPLIRLMTDPGCRPCITMLDDNFRSLPGIIEMFNPTYDNRLRARAVIPQQQMQYVERAYQHVCQSQNMPRVRHSDDDAAAADVSFPVIFIHSDGQEQREEDSPSWMNMAEANIVCELVTFLAARGSTHHGDIVVLSPYAKQVKKINGKLHHDFNGDVNRPVASSIEMFQGKEAPVVVLSCVRSSQKMEIVQDVNRHLGFLKQPQRLNVAVSRPKALLVIVGNANTLMADAEWRRILILLWDRNTIFVARSCRSLTVHDPNVWAQKLMGDAIVQEPHNMRDETAEEVVYSRAE